MKRYDIGTLPFEDESSMLEDDNGDYVAYRDYQALEQQVETLKELHEVAGQIVYWKKDYEKGICIIHFEINKPNIK